MLVIPLDKTILNIFCTFIDEAEEQKIRGAFMATAYLRACLMVSSRSCSLMALKMSNLVPIKNGTAPVTSVLLDVNR